MVAYLRTYAQRLPAEIRTSTTVASATRRKGAWVVRAEDGRKFTVRALVAATGDYGTPYVPEPPGRNRFGGSVLHAAAYRTPEPFTGQRIVVVGGGNSAIQIAAELGPAAKVALATRRPIDWTPQRPLGKDLHWWLTRTGLDVAPLSRWLHRLPVSVLDDGHWCATLEEHGVDRRQMFARLTAEGVVRADGTKEAADTVLLATGYRPAFPYLADSGALDPRGRPVHRGGVATTTPGLAFAGLEFQRSFSSKPLLGVGRDATHVLARLRRQQS
ncbi:NAD(P)/FAD-dependent oxidoreductase [Streptomyces verrucosisporus]|uniref:flavin-containing monooxygenase n=1 Tax=Streptomyces verrucosisporus TaxID=1695161 RepID=UPI0027DA54EC|nr:NAD(P)/FAD-dependent oxidoreductase [Streptomyces verrucosisporus]MBN3933145.1 NAD(P)/FAD-dependent oxidoreductase [Streptomyces verrucosisporus]